jgi:hypothetical protein
MIIVAKETVLEDCKGFWYVADDHGIADGGGASYLWKDSTWHSNTGAGNLPVPQCPGWFPSKEEALGALSKTGLQPDRIID